MLNTQLISDRILNSYRDMWEHVHPFSDISILSYARLDRNISLFPFRDYMNELQRKDLLESVRNGAFSTDISIQTEDFSKNDLLLLEERNVLRDNEVPDGFILSDDRTWIIINGYNHISMFIDSGSSDCESIVGSLYRLEKKIGQHFPYSFSEQFGYLFPNPDDSGFGLQIGTILHLPAMTILKNISEIRNLCTEQNIGLVSYMDQSEKSPYYILTAKESVDSPEISVHTRLMKTVEIIGAMERDAREEYYLEFKHHIDDAVWRSYGMLSYARMLNYKEGMDYLSNIRLGVVLSIIKNLTIAEINELIFLTKRSHIQCFQNKGETSQLESEISRAQYIRNYLHERS